MAIIYTYPVKATAAADDLILISDSADSNKTKQVKVSSLPSSGAEGTPSAPLNSIQFNNNSAFGGSANLTYAADTLTIQDNIVIKGDGTADASKLKFNCFNNNHHVEIIGPDHNNSPASYSITLPNKIATQSAVSGGRVLEVNSSGVGNWIATPASTAPQGDDGQYQYKNGSSFSGADNLRFDADKIHIGKGGATPTRGQLVMYGDGTNASDIQLYNSGNNRSLTIAQQAGATQDLTLTFPGVAPGGNDKILQSDSSGQLSWINTPTGTTYSAGTGLSLTGTTFANTDLGSSQYIYKNFTATSGGTATANSNNDTLTLAAGSGITTTRSGDTITIAATGGSGAAGGQTPVDYAVSTGFEATGGSVQYFYIFTCHGDFTLSRMYWYQNSSSSQVVTWAIYQGNLSSATLLGQGSATATQSAVNFVTMTAEEGQNLNLVKGNTYVIGHQQGGQNGSVACLTSAVSSSGLAVTYAGAGGFPATFPDGELTYTATGIRPCVSLVP